MREEWRDIEGYPNYSVSNWGNVRNKNTGQYLKTTPVGLYHIVGLRHNNLQDTHPIHRVVARAFMGNIDGVQILHVNGDTSYNHISNLRKHYRRTVRKGNLGAPVRCLETGIIYDTVADAAQALGGSKNGIYNALNGYSFTYKGYHFEYVD